MYRVRNVVISVASLIFLLGAAIPAYGAPRIAFDREAVDHGYVPYGQMVVHSFRFTNEGTEPLRITGPFCHDNLIMTKALEGC